MTLSVLVIVNVNSNIHFILKKKKKSGFVDLRFVKPSDEHDIEHESSSSF